jgi:hypothetical protein
MGLHGERPVFYTDPLIRAIPPSARPGRHETFVAIDALAPDRVELLAHVRQLPRHRGLEELPAFGIVGQDQTLEVLPPGPDLGPSVGVAAVVSKWEQVREGILLERIDASPPVLRVFIASLTPFPYWQQIARRSSSAFLNGLTSQFGIRWNARPSDTVVSASGGPSRRAALKDEEQTP